MAEKFLQKIYGTVLYSTYGTKYVLILICDVTV